jgi:hypothetical protein
MASGQRLVMLFALMAQMGSCSSEVDSVIAEMTSKYGNVTVGEKTDNCPDSCSCPGQSNCKCRGGGGRWQFECDCDGPTFCSLPGCSCGKEDLAQEKEAAYEDKEDVPTMASGISEVDSVIAEMTSKYGNVTVGEKTDNCPGSCSCPGQSNCKCAGGGGNPPTWYQCICAGPTFCSLPGCSCGKEDLAQEKEVAYEEKEDVHTMASGTSEVDSVIAEMTSKYGNVTVGEKTDSCPGSCSCPGQSNCKCAGGGGNPPTWYQCICAGPTFCSLPGCSCGKEDLAQEDIQV